MRRQEAGFARVQSDRDALHPRRRKSSRAIRQGARSFSTSMERCSTSHPHPTRSSCRRGSPNCSCASRRASMAPWPSSPGASSPRSMRCWRRPSSSAAACTAPSCERRLEARSYAWQPRCPSHSSGSSPRLAERLPGIIAEPKGPGFAIHYRQAPELEGRRRGGDTRAAGAIRRRSRAVPGPQTVRDHPGGPLERHRLETLAALPTFSGRTPIMIGDDVGDVPALAAAERSWAASGLRVAGGHFGRAKVDLDGPAKRGRLAHKICRTGSEPES